MPLIPALRVQRKADSYGFKAILVYKASSRTPILYRKTVKNPKPQKEKSDNHFLSKTMMYLLVNHICTMRQRKYHDNKDNGFFLIKKKKKWVRRGGACL